MKPGVSSRLTFAQYQRMTFRHHDVFGHWFVPGIRAYVAHERGFYAVVTNSIGMRDSKDYGLRAPAGTRRILVFGDSFTAGDGVDNEERFTGGMERTVPNLELLNFGLPNSGTDQQYLVYEHLARQFDGDILLVCPLVENINRNVARYRPVIDRGSGSVVLAPKPYFTRANGRLELRGVPVPRQRVPLHEAPAGVLAHAGLAPCWQLARSFSRHAFLHPFREMLIRLGRFDPYPQYSVAAHPDWLLMRGLLGKFVEHADGRPVVLVPLPTYHYIERLVRPSYLVRFREFATDTPGVYLVDVLPEFWHLPPKERRACRYPRDVHYTPLGHAVVARALVDALQAAPLL